MNPFQIGFRTIWKYENSPHQIRTIQPEKNTIRELLEILEYVYII